MKFKLKDSLIILLLIILFVAVGFLRDAVFININSQLYKLYFKNYAFTLPNWLTYFNAWPYMKLYYFKYFLTVTFIILYFLLTALSVKLFTGDTKNIKWVFYAYAIVLILSLLSFSIGYFFNNFSKGYLFARNLLGLLQSPFITMLIIPALKLDKQQKTL